MISVGYSFLIKARPIVWFYMLYLFGFQPNFGILMIFSSHQLPRDAKLLTQHPADLEVLSGTR